MSNASRSLTTALLATLGATTAFAVDERPIAEPRLPKLTCHQGYLKLEAPHGLEGVHAALGQALERGDPAAQRFLEERLTEVIGGDPRAALQVMEWAQSAQEPALSLYLRAVRETEAVHAPAVVERLARMAETHPDPDHQANAMMALETQRRFEPTLLERFTTLARKDTLAPGVAMSVVRTVGRVMNNDFQRTGDLEPYMGGLLDVAHGSTNPHVRSLAIEMGTYPKARLEGKSLQRLAKFVTGEPDPDVREMAALVLSSGRDTQLVLDTFRDVFPREKDECVRWAFVRFAMRAGGAQALPLLKDFARQDARFQRDYADFKSLYDTGQVDFDRVFPQKAIRHRCGG